MNYGGSETSPPSPPHHRISSSNKASTASSRDHSTRHHCAIFEDLDVPIRPANSSRLTATTMAEPSPNPAQPTADPESTPLANGDSAPADIEMADSVPAQDVRTLRSHWKYSKGSRISQQPLNPTAALQPTVQTAPPTPAPVVQPPPPVSSRNSPHPSAPAQQAPTQPIPHGSPTRVYLNQNVTPHLLEAMKHLATTEPEKPLKWLSEFLAMKSAELEG
jgi:COMPASS component SDC1